MQPFPKLTLSFAASLQFSTTLLLLRHAHCVLCMRVCVCVCICLRSSSEMGCGFNRSNNNKVLLLIKYNLRPMDIRERERERERERKKETIQNKNTKQTKQNKTEPQYNSKMKTQERMGNRNRILTIRISSTVQMTFPSRHGPFSGNGVPPEERPPSPWSPDKRCTFQQQKVMTALCGCPTETLWKGLVMMLLPPPPAPAVARTRGLLMNALRPQSGPLG